MSKLLGAICIVKETFDEYSNGDGPDAYLTKKELTALLKKEILGESAPSEEIDEFFNTLDTDGDGVVNYEEYVTFVASFCVMFHHLDGDHHHE